jgi:Zn-finger nucleic acid-binding protein
VTCPACGRALAQRTVGDLTVDACEGGCGGIWFDNFELQKVDEPSEAVGEQLLDISADPALTIDRTQRYRCPKCDPPPVLMRHFESIQRKATIDQCPSCNGVWLDPGELRTIRSEYPSDAAKQAAADAYFADMFPQLAAEHEAGEAGLEEARAFQRRFHFLFPSSTRI